MRLITAFWCGVLLPAMLLASTANPAPHSFHIGSSEQAVLEALG